MEHDFIIFGGTGQQGRICARDLIESGYTVMLAGRDSSKIKNLLKSKKAYFIRIDLRNQRDIINAIKKSKARVVINCAELNFNIPIMKACLNAKRHCIDLGGLHDITIEQFNLEKNFKKNKLMCITGCGSTPGIVNIMTAHIAEDYDSIDSIEAGFAWDSNKKIFVTPYSIKSIFDEFTENPIFFHNGRFVKTDQMSCYREKYFKEIGRQKCYCIVHSEIYTFSKYFKNKGVKKIHYLAGFPDHSLIKIKNLIELGFDSDNPIKIKDIEIRPRDFTTELLKRLQPPKDYLEKENLWVVVEGNVKGKKKTTEMNCIVKTIKGWEDAGSNVNTGRTISIISQMIYDGSIKGSGVYAPEGIVPHKIFFKELAKRKMTLYLNGKKIN